LYIYIAAKKADIDAKLLHSYLPRDFVLWIDPFSVAYRVGDHGNIMTLFEDRSRGRITFKVDPATTNSESTNTGSPALNHSVINGAFKSPVNSPRLQHLQPRSNAVRITPPNSPEKSDPSNKKSRGQSQTSQQQQQQTGAQEQQNQQLVLAN
jgi:hypothetical protein